MMRTSQGPAPAAPLRSGDRSSYRRSWLQIDKTDLGQVPTPEHLPNINEHLFSGVKSSNGSELAVVKQTDYDMLDCVMVECTTIGCPQKGMPTAVDICSGQKNQGLLFTPPKDVMCGNVLDRKKIEMDRRLV